MDTRLIVSANSDIARYLTSNWSSRGIRVLGTTSSKHSCLEGIGIAPTDILNLSMVNAGDGELVTSWLLGKQLTLSHVIFATGTQIPVGTFYSCDFEQWHKSIEVNTLAQLRVLHAVRPLMRVGGTVCFFAGAGSNSAPQAYSAYVSSKIHLTKMVELLDAEDPELKYVIVGPGWVDTKIHAPTLESSDDQTAGNTTKTLEMYSQNTGFTSFETILKCFDWVIDSPRAIVSGRNFSVVHDAFGTTHLNHALSNDMNMYKLRRFGNDWRAA